MKKIETNLFFRECLAIKKMVEKLKLFTGKKLAVKSSSKRSGIYWVYLLSIFMVAKFPENSFCKGVRWYTNNFLCVIYGS